MEDGVCISKGKKGGIRGIVMVGTIAALASIGLHAPEAKAVPAFARQTGQPCAGCHVGGFGPQLTPFGRQFKLTGYTLKAGSIPEVPLSAMVVESFTHTAKDQTDVPAKHFGTNDNTELEQASLFVAGRIAEHLGIFSQATYSQNGGIFGWDNVDLRYANTISGAKHSGVWGVSLNNNPTVSDIFNTAPAWQFPYMSADLAPGAPAAPLLSDGLGGSVAGASVYAQIDGSWYLEGGGYRSLSPSFLRKVNADYAGRIAGLAPYARVAYTWTIPGGNVELGGFFMDVRKGLVGEDAQGNAIALAGPNDRFRDYGIDASWQRFIGADHTFTANASYIHESQKLDATFGSGGSSNLRNSLSAFNLNGSYWYQNTWGGTLAAFANNGSADDTLYGGRPNTSGGMAEIAWNPFGKLKSWAQPYVNVRIGLQYTFYNRFNGLTRNVDGAGRSASDNNTTFLYFWTAL